MNIHEGAAHYGHNALAAMVGETPQVLTHWKVRGVPLNKCAAVEARTDGAIPRWHTRPDDWHLIWPELIGTEGAPAVPEPAKA